MRLSMPLLSTVAVFLAVCVGCASALGTRPLFPLRRCRAVAASPVVLFATNDNKGDRISEDKRRIVRYDNVGDPIYEGDENATGTNGINVLGINVNLDPTSLTLLGFGLIAFNFFVLANL